MYVFLMVWSLFFEIINCIEASEELVELPEIFIESSEVMALPENFIENDELTFFEREPSPELLAQRARKRANTAAYRARLQKDEKAWASHLEKERERDRNRPQLNCLERERRADFARARDEARVQRVKADPVKRAAFLARRAEANKKYRERKKAGLVAGKKRERE